MSNSPLVNLTGISPFTSGKRTQKIDRITPHCIVGNFPLERLPLFFDNEECSCNYAIAKDGRIALIVPEDEISWCSSSESNDGRAVTIECSSLSTAPYTFNNEVYEALADLTVDIMNRNGLSKLVYIPDSNVALNTVPKQGECMLTFHRWFAAKACPGDWFVEKAQTFTDYVNKKISTGVTPTPTQPVNLYRVNIGAFRVLDFAVDFVNKAKEYGYDAFYTQDADGLYKVQIGAFSERENAVKLADRAKKDGFNTYIVGET